MYVNMLFSVNIHGKLKYIFANFCEDSRKTDVHVRYFLFSVKISDKCSIFIDIVRELLRVLVRELLRSLVAVKLL